jgi:hypothetical protein
MGSLQPWHFATLLCCVAVVAGIGLGVYFAVKAANKKKS